MSCIYSIWYRYGKLVRKKGMQANVTGEWTRDQACRMKLVGNLLDEVGRELAG